MLCSFAARFAKLKHQNSAPDSMVLPGSQYIVSALIWRSEVGVISNRLESSNGRGANMSNSKFATCRLCAGTGMLRSSPGEECSDCDGRGFIDRDSETYWLQHAAKYKRRDHRALPKEALE